MLATGQNTKSRIKRGVKEKGEGEKERRRTQGLGDKLFIKIEVFKTLKALDRVTR